MELVEPEIVGVGKIGELIDLAALKIHCKKIVRISALGGKYYSLTAVEEAVIGEINMVAVCSVRGESCHPRTRFRIGIDELFGFHKINSILNIYAHLV